MNQFNIWWTLLPGVVKTTLWIAFGLVLAYVLWRLLPPRRIRWVAVGIFLAVFELAPPAVPRARMAIEDYGRQKSGSVASLCREAMALAQQASSSPLRVEGFLDTTDHDKLINDRFQRTGAIIEAQQEGGTVTIDTGSYTSHPVAALLKGSTFAAMARHVLMDKRYSFVEFEMVPQKDGTYTNAGFIKTQSWSGPRYRLYYLAPGDQPNCARENEGITPPLTPVAAGQPATQSPSAERPVCVALEITSTPVSNYVLTADEPSDWHRWSMRTQGISIPMWTSIRWDRIRVSRIGGGEVARYLGFDHPDEVSPAHRCHNDTAVARLLSGVLIPDHRRAFLRAKSWYEGSAVQRFYESAPNGGIK